MSETSATPHTGSHGTRKQYIVIFVILAALTALEVLVAKVLKEQRGVMAGLLVSMAVAKAGFVALYFMHLKHEKRALKLVVGIPMLFPPLYAVVLMLEALFRYTLR